MKVYGFFQSRDEYIGTQIKRSKEKFSYCKVSMNDALNYINKIRRYNKLKETDSSKTPLICLGTRNGREVDLFRVAMRNPFVARLIAGTESTERGFNSIFDVFVTTRRSDVNAIDENSVIGVEINPIGKRRDIWIGSFDELPKDWEGRFNVIYSNSFDHSQDPYRTAKEWIKIAKNNAILILAFYNLEDDPSEHDPVTNIKLSDILELFPGELLYFDKAGSFNNYDEVILQLKK
jgi:hypothetical protein